MRDRYHVLKSFKTARSKKISLSLSDLFTALRQPGHCLCEYLSNENNLVKLYFDSDAYYSPPDISDIPYIIESRLFLIRQAMDHAMTLLSDISPLVSYVIASRHGRVKQKFKVSFRVYVDGICAHHHDIPAFLPILFPLKDHLDLWDTSVYKPDDQCMGAILGLKEPDDTRRLVPLVENDLENHLEYHLENDSFLARFVIQHYDDSWPPMSIPPQEIIGSVPTEDNRDILALMELLGPETARDYASWRNVAIILKSIDPFLYLDAFRSFSVKAGPPAYTGQEDVDKLWNSLKLKSQKSHNKLLTVDTLRWYARRDDPAGYKLYSINPKFNPKLNLKDQSLNTMDEDQTMSLASKILRILESPYQISSTSTSTITDDVILIHAQVSQCSDVILNDLINDRMTHEGIIKLSLRDLRVTVVVNTTLVHDQFIHKDQAIEIVGYDPASIHKDIKSGLDWSVTRPCDNKALFKTSSSDTTIELLNFDRPGHESIRVDLSDLRKSSRLTNKRDIAGLHAAYQGALKNAAIHKLDIGFLILGNNNIIINESHHINPDTNRKSDEDVSNLIVSSAPEFMARIKFVPDVKTNNCNGVYYCDPLTNIWAQKPNAVLEQYIISLVKSLVQKEGPTLSPTLSPQDLKHIESRRGRGDILYSVACKRISEKFDEELDADPDLFAVDNGVFSTKTLTFREICPDDKISTTSGWSYLPDKAHLHREELEDFLGRVLPVPEERRIVLSYFAGLLSGRRIIKKFMVFTDRRSGNNGKTTLANLMTLFFGAYTEKSTKFVCKGSFSRDRDSHDAGLEPFKSKRLLVAEELKSDMELDSAMLKSFAGGPGNIVRGRRCGNSSRFEFLWQAGFLLIFNEGDCPKFDSGDQAFIERMIVAPFRSKFVPIEDAHDNEDFTYPMDKTISEKFKDWLSALADVLIDHYDPDALDNPPPSMREWRQGIAGDANPLAEWLQGSVRVTGDSSDTMFLSDLKKAFFESSTRDFNAPLVKTKFSMFAKAYFNGIIGVSFKDLVKINNVVVRGVFTGICFTPSNIL